jgi:apolipoprotein N-acyltransferase
MSHAASPDLALPSTRAQWSAVLVTVALMVVLGLGLPRLADSTAPADTAVAAGDRVVARGVAVTVSEGWALAGGTDLLVLNKQDAKLFVLPPSASTQAPEDAVEQAEQGYTTDTSVQATIGEVQSFTTDSGLEAASVTIVQPDLVTVLYAFSDGTTLATGNASATPGTWSDLKDEVDEMAATVEFETGASS